MIIRTVNETKPIKMMPPIFKKALFNDHVNFLDCARPNFNNNQLKNENILVPNVCGRRTLLKNVEKREKRLIKFTSIIGISLYTLMRLGLHRKRKYIRTTFTRNWQYVSYLNKCKNKQV